MLILNGGVIWKTTIFLKGSYQDKSYICQRHDIVELKDIKKKTGDKKDVIDLFLIPVDKKRWSLFKSLKRMMVVGAT